MLKKLFPLSLAFILSSCITVQMQVPEEVIQKEVEKRLNSSRATVTPSEKSSVIVPSGSSNIENSTISSSRNSNISNSNERINDYGDYPGIADVVNVESRVSKLSLEKGTSNKIQAAVNNEDGTQSNDLRWESSNPNVLRVDSNGEIEAVSEGTAIITASAKRDSSRATEIEVEVKG